MALQIAPVAVTLPHLKVAFRVVPLGLPTQPLLHVPFMTVDQAPLWHLMEGAPVNPTVALTLHLAKQSLPSKTAPHVKRPLGGLIVGLPVQTLRHLPLVDHVPEDEEQVALTDPEKPVAHAPVHTLSVPGRTISGQLNLVTFEAVASAVNCAFAQARRVRNMCRQAGSRHREQVRKWVLCTKQQLAWRATWLHGFHSQLSENALLPLAARNIQRYAQKGSRHDVYPVLEACHLTW